MRRVAPAVIVLTFAVAVFAMNATIAREFDRLHVFDENDILFQADPPCRLSNLAHGWCDRGRGYIHPNLANLANLPVRALARLAVTFGVADADEAALRRQLAVFYAPLVSALQLVVVFLLLRRLRFSIPAALIVAIFAAISFCQLIYGSIPESYALSSFAIAVAYLLAADTMHAKRRFSGVLAVAVGILAAGITVTNIVPLSILRWITRRQVGSSVGASLKHTAAYVVIVIGCTFASAAVLDRAYRSPRSPIEAVQTFATEYRRDDVIRRLADFPVALATTIVAATPRTVPLAPESRTHRLGFTLAGAAVRSPQQRIVTVMVVVMLLVGLARAWASSGERRAIAHASVVIIVYNGLLHSLWGDQFFLYASHWLIPLVVLIGGALPLSPRTARMPLAALGALSLAVAVVNAQTLADMFALLRLQAAPY